MLTVAFGVALGLIISLIGCSSSAAKPDASLSADSRITALEARLAKIEIEKTTQKRYQLHNFGNRVFRFDPETGDSCILMTSEADWKQSSTKSQSCSCIDLLRKYPEATEKLITMTCGR
jgi:hypothetical protein